MVPRENENNAYAKFWRTNKECYGIFESGPFVDTSITLKKIQNTATIPPGPVDHFQLLCGPNIFGDFLNPYPNSLNSLSLSLRAIRELILLLKTTICHGSILM